MTASAIGGLVSKVGVPDSANDLKSYEYELVLHSIKQDLSAVQRRANTRVSVDWELLMQPGAPEEPRHILQGLVYVAKIKDVANTRGGAQVSQHRRVLAQQTYNMLVQELSDVLQRQEVQRGLRDLSARSNLDAERNKTFNATQVLTSKSGNTGLTLENDGTDASVRSHGTIDELADELLQLLDGSAFGEDVKKDNMYISNAGENDATNTQEKLETLRTQIQELSADAQLQEKISLTIDVLNIIQQYRNEELVVYEAGVKEYTSAVTSLKKQLNQLRGLTSQFSSDPEGDMLQLNSQIETTHEKYNLLVEQTRQKLTELKDFEENVDIDDEQVHRGNIEIWSTREEDGRIILTTLDTLFEKYNENDEKNNNLADEINQIITRLENIRVQRDKTLQIYDDSVDNYINALTHFKEKVVNLRGHKQEPTIQEPNIRITFIYEIYKKEVERTKDELASAKKLTKKQIQRVQQLQTPHIQRKD